MNERARTIGAVTHPLVCTAAALILLNDHVLRGAAPGWLTGKLSDVGWLVVVPVVLAAGLALIGVRRARGAGLALAVAVYAALQLWPPLGQAFSARHVADVGDLLVLPAAFGAVVAWRGARGGARSLRGAGLALPVFVGVLVADSWNEPQDASWPCGEGQEWPAAQPFRLTVGGVPDVPADTDGFARGLRLTTGGVEVPLVVARVDGWAIVVCAREGLRADTDYTWEIGPWDAPSSNSYAFEHGALPTVQFRAVGAGVEARTAAACAALVSDLPGDMAECGRGSRDSGGEWDTGDTGDSGDTGVR